MLLQGKELAERVVSGIRDEIHRKRIRPRLGIILVGDDPASHIYVRKKMEKARSVGMEAELFHLPRDSGENEVLALVRKLNNDRRISGFIVQLPLPRHLNSNQIIGEIEPSKDVDGLHPYNLGKLVLNVDGFAPATPLGVMMLLERYKVKLSGANAVVIGRSSLVGKPVALMLLHKDASVTICHSKTQNLAEHTKKADVLVVAAGSPWLIKPGMVRKGAYVIDVGTTRVKDKILGDVHPSVQKKANVSPVPGGVGPLTVALLLQNTLKAAKMSE